MRKCNWVTLSANARNPIAVHFLDDTKISVSSASHITQAVCHKEYDNKYTVTEIRTILFWHAIACYIWQQRE